MADLWEKAKLLLWDRGEEDTLTNLVLTFDWKSAKAAVSSLMRALGLGAWADPFAIAILGCTAFVMLVGLISTVFAKEPVLAKDAEKVPEPAKDR